MCIKLNLYGKDLAYRYGEISKTTVFRTFNNILDVMNACLKPVNR